MTLQQLRYAIGIAKIGSFNKAAEELFISQPSLTAAIHDLEDEIGIVIFNRTSRGVSLTVEGEEFIAQASQLYHHYETVLEHYSDGVRQKRKFAISTQHYSFAVKAFVEMAKHYDMKKFDFAIRETRTKKVITDVGRLRSEIGILYMSAANQKLLKKLFSENEVEFHPLVRCQAYVYLWEGHPLAGEKSIGMDTLEPYPCLSFEQGEDDYYLSEEILSENDYPRTVKACDRATMLNLMVGINGYTLCSGIISGDLNGDGYVVVPFCEDEENQNTTMEIGYITKKNSVLSKMGEDYLAELKRYLNEVGADMF
jgi:DNA-binding transcriptional LysR family regulator